MDNAVEAEAQHRLLRQLLLATPRDQAAVAVVLAQIARQDLYVAFGFEDLVAFALAQGVTKSTREILELVPLVEQMGDLLDRVIALRSSISLRPAVQDGRKRNGPWAEAGATGAVGAAFVEESATNASTASAAQELTPLSTGPSSSSSMESASPSTSRSTSSDPSVRPSPSPSSSPSEGTSPSLSSSPSEHATHRSQPEPDGPGAAGRVRVLPPVANDDAARGRASRAWSFKRSKQAWLDERQSDRVEGVFARARAYVGADLTEGETLDTVCKLADKQLIALECAKGAPRATTGGRAGDCA